MPNKRDLKLDQYNISKARYRELYYFCLQYPEWVKERQSCYSLDSKPLDGMPRGSRKADMTAVKAERACRLGRNIELIERTAVEAAGELYPWVLEAVTKGMSWEDIMPPCGIRQFRDSRRRFYYLLSLKK